MSLHEAVGRDPKPVRFVCSTRLTSFGDETASSTHAITSRLERYPDLEFKLDPENDWTPELIDEIAEVATVQVMDLKGYYKGTVVEVETDPELYRAVAEKFPEAWLEDPDLTDETREVLKPHWDRLTYDAPLHSLEDVKKLAARARDQLEAVALWLARRAARRSTRTARSRGLQVYGGGQGEVGLGRGQIQYLASLYHPDTPNDTAPAGYNDPAVPEGMPTSPMDPVPSRDRAFAGARPLRGPRLGLGRLGRGERLLPRLRLAAARDQVEGLKHRAADRVVV